ncbi:uncharacterized protein LOC109799085 isoform X2 [Cajanus cajan]|uniref:uncharacterized protein LOC109799085 isoform X2 n=1 Tax=Cajanus cajan TaxID=3821 RepID=UPI00098DB1B8|nr:uncharacterized protein LOC109799085 isoform X2 [Cajanus cajan]
MLSGVRTGLKREFAFAMKYQSEIYVSTGRTRSNMTQNAVQVPNRSNKKRYKKSNLEKPKSGNLTDLVKNKEEDGDTMNEKKAKSDAYNSEEPKSQVGGEATTIVCKEMYKSDETKTKVVQTKKQLTCDDEIKDGAGGNDSMLGCKAKPTRRFTQSTLKNLDDGDGNKFPSKLKDLLSSRILDGLPVNYVRSTKAKVVGTRGVISGNGVVCYCEVCNGIEVVTPTVFELHAGSSNKRPPEYIFLENGNTLRDVMNMFLNIPLRTLEEALQRILGAFIFKKSKFCVNCRDVNVVSRLFCNSCTMLKDCQPFPTQTTETSNIYLSEAVQSRSLEPDMLPKLVDSGMKQNACHRKSQGKLTKKDLRLHKLVFEADVLPDGTEVSYYSHGQKLLVGYKKGYGIICSCCNNELSPSQFEAHAGWASRRKPYLHIYTSNGVSLHELSITLSKDPRFSTNDNDDLCRICLDGGDLLCCDSCPRAFHKECVNLPCIPSGVWYCKYCQNKFQKDKYVERNENAKAAGRIDGIDPLEQINQRCIRIVKEFDYGGCALCRCQYFTKSFGPRTVIICDQCEKEYHIVCLKNHNIQNLKELPKGNWFCSSNCNQIHTDLASLVARGEENIPNSLLSVIKKKYDDKGLKNGDDLDIKWRVLNWKLDESDENEEMLSKVVDIFHEQFDPIVHPTTRVDFIPTMLFGRKTKSQDFRGMYCAVLIVNQMIVSAGIFRVFGLEVAELPLVATVADYQGQGYFKTLFNCIEDLLRTLKVKHFVLPAATEAESLWTSKFGFTKLDQDGINNYRRYYHMMTFQGTSLLHKPIPAL